MAGHFGDRRWFTPSRGRIILLLRRSRRTVEDLAHALELTDNAVRAHLSTLERDGLVQQRGVRRGASKPALMYELTPEAERLFPKAYAPVLRQLLDTLAARLPPEELESVIQATGRHLAAERLLPTGDRQQRLRWAVDLLNDLGGLAELETHETGWRIDGYRCPLTEIAPDHPEVCRLTAALLSEAVGEPIVEHCQRVESPQCCFIPARTPEAKIAGD